MTEFKNQTSFLIQKCDSGNFLVAVGKKTFEGTSVSVNLKASDIYFAGFDNPTLFEMYEDVHFNVDVEVEPDESISVEIEML